MFRVAATDVIVHGAWRWFVEWFARRPAADASVDAIADLAAAIAIGDAPADAPADALAGRRFEKKAITRINRIGKKRDVGGVVQEVQARKGKLAAYNIGHSEDKNKRGSEAGLFL